MGTSYETKKKKNACSMPRLSHINSFLNTANDKRKAVYIERCTCGLGGSGSESFSEDKLKLTS